MAIGTPRLLGSATSTGSTATSVALTTTANINAGDAVLVAVALQGLASGDSVQSVTDGINTYGLIGGVSNGSTIDVELWGAFAATAVLSGATITATFTSTASTASGRNIQAAAVSGINSPLAVAEDAPTLQSAITAATTSVSQSTGPLVQQSELILGLSLTSTTGTETQSAGFANIVTTSAGVVDKFAMDYQIVSTPASVTYAPVWSISGTVSQIVVGIKAFTTDVAWEQVPQWQPPHRAPERKYSAIRGRSQFPIFSQWYFPGWEVPPTQYIHPRSERGAAVLSGDSGVYDVQRNWVNQGQEVQSVQPPHPGWEKRAAGWLPTGDRGAYDIFRVWFNQGQEVQSFQPPHPGWEKRAAGWLPTGDRGAFTAPQQPARVGWEQVPQWQPPATKPRIRYGGLRSSSQFAVYSAWVNMGWEVQPVQPPHQWWERKASADFKFGDIGAYFIGTLPVIPGWEVQHIQPPRRKWERAAAIKSKSAFAIFPYWLLSGWEIAPPITRQPRPRRPGFFTNENILRPRDVTNPTPHNWGFVFNDIHMRRHLRERLTATKGKSHFAIFSAPVPWGWDVAYTLVPHPRKEKGAGIEGLSEFAIPTPFPLGGWDVFYGDVKRPRFARWGGIATGSQGTDDIFRRFITGWTVTYLDGIHRRTEKAGALAAGSQGIDAKFVVPTFWDWQVFHADMKHPRPERWGSIAAGTQGTENPLVNPFYWQWRLDYFDIPHPRPARSGALVFERSGIENVFSFSPPPIINGWDYVYAQPRHPRPEKQGAFADGSQGTDNVFSFTPPVFANGYEQVYAWTAHPRPEKSAAIAAGSQGTDNLYSFVVTYILDGWESILHDLPHPRPERFGGLAVGLPGIENVFTYVPPPTINGWDTILHYQPHPRPEKQGAFADGSQGTDNVFTYVPPPIINGWWTTDIQLPHLFRERAGAVLGGSDRADESFLYQIPAWGWYFQPADIRYKWHFVDTNDELVSWINYFATVFPPNRNQIYSALTGGLGTLGGV